MNRSNRFHPALNLVLAVLYFGAYAGAALAQESAAGYPNRPIKLVVPYAPGGFPDTVARVVGQRVGEVLGQPLVVDNRPGAGGIAASEFVMRSPADGYTLLLMDNAHWAINPALNPKLSYDPLRDFAPIALVAMAPLFLAVNASVPATNLQELITLVKSKPNQFNYGSSGIGSLHHLAMEMLKSRTGLEIVHIPYKGAGQSVPALLGGQVSMLFAALPTLSGHVKSGSVRTLAVLTNRRVAMAPTVPTFAELGVAGVDFLPLVGLLGPAGLPAPLVSRLSTEFGRAVENPEIVQRLALAGVEPAASTPEGFIVQIKEDLVKLAAAVRISGLKVTN